MLSQANSSIWQDLINELKTLQHVFDWKEVSKECVEIREEINELEELISGAGFPEDEHSHRALVFLEQELARKRAELHQLQ